MSVAGSLAALRQSVRRPSQRSASVARSELAASARNALSLLQRADTQLPALMRPLLLLSPDVDRLTLPPDAERELRVAAVELVRRLAPVFLLRAAQTVLEWLVVGLSLPTHGSDEEYDELLIAALPFCEELSFVRLVKRMAPLRPKWHFLWPVVKQSKPAALSFIVKNMPQHLFPIVMQAALRSASINVHTTFISTFLANTLTRRILIPSEAPSLTLSCVTSLEKLISKKFLKRAKTVPTDLIAAMLSAIAIAMSSAHVELPVLQAASQVCACVLLNCKVPELTLAAASCLVLTSSSLPAFVPSKAAANLLRSSVLKAELHLLHPSDASSLYGALVRACIGKKPNKIRWLLLKDALSDSSLLTTETVRQILVDLLDKMSPKLEPDGLVPDEAVEGLVSVIEPLARGRFAEAVDHALREHYKRRKGKGRENRYSVVNAAFAKALHGTQFAIVNVTEDFSSGSLLAALDHPEPSVRCAALQQFVASKDLTWCDENDVLQSILAKLSTMIRLEDDLEMVNTACDCVLKVSRHDDLHPILATIVARYIGEHEKMMNKRPKRKKLMRRLTALSALFSKILVFCERLVSKNPSSIYALLIGIVITGFLPNPIGNDDETKVRELLVQHGKKFKPEKNGPETDISNVKQYSTTVLKEMLLLDGTDMLSFCDALTMWNGGWILNASHLWFEHIDNGIPLPTPKSTLKCILQILYQALETDAHLFRPIVRLLVDYCKLFCHKSSLGTEPNLLADVWCMVAKDAEELSCQAILRTIVSEINLDACLQLLKDACFSGANKHVKALSLKWYVNICIVHRSEDVRKEAMVVLMRILYGDDIEMQKVALALSHVTNSKEGLKKRERRTEFWNLLTAASKLPDDFKWEPYGKELHRLVATDLQKWVIDSIRTPPPLTCATIDEEKHRVKFNDLLVYVCKEEDLHIINAYLRALHGYRIQTVEHCSSITVVLSSHLQRMLSPSEDRNIVVENTARMTQLLLQAQTDTFSQAPSLTNLSFLTISQLKKLSPKAISSDDSCEKYLITLLSLSVIVVNTLKKTEAHMEHRIPHLGYLFSISSVSSRLGISTRKNIDLLCQNSVSCDELVEVLKTGYVTLTPPAKRVKVASRNFLREFSEVSREAYRGVLEAVLRLTTRNNEDRFACFSGPLDALKGCLFDLFISSSELMKEDRFSIDELEYEMSLLLQVLTNLFKIQPSRINHTININAIAEKAQYVDDGSEESPLALGLRQSAIVLLEVLAPVYGAEMQGVLAPVIEGLVRKGNLSKALNSMEAFVPALIESGCDFERICLWIIEAAYSNGSPSNSTKGEVLLSSCCRLVPDSQQALLTSIRHVEKRLMYSEDDNVAQICTTLLQDAQLSLADDLITMQSIPARIRCKTAFSVLQSPTFTSKLYTTAHTLSNDDEMKLTHSFSLLFLELLVCDDMDGRRDSVAALVAILPLHVFQKCVVQGLTSKDSKVRSRTMETIRDRLGAEDSPLLYSWKMDGASVLSKQKARTTELLFLKEVGNILCSICKGKYSFALYEERITAGSTMDKLVLAMGSSQRQTVLFFADMLLGLVQSERVNQFISGAQPKAEELQLTANCLDLFSNFVRCLGKHAVPFVPVVLATASEVLDIVFNPKRSLPTSKSAFSMLICISESAIKFITAVLDNCPLFLGTRALQSLIALNFCSDADVLSGLLALAMKKASSETISLALSKIIEKLNGSNTSPRGISRLIRALSGGLEEMDKSEVRLHMDQFLQSITRCLEYSRNEPRTSSAAKVDPSNTKQGSAQDSSDNLLSEHRDVDQTCGDALTSLALKLPESKFKKLFNGLIQWCDGGSMSTEELASCETFGVDVTPNVARATPFYRVVLRFFEKLQVIMIPYVFQVLEKILAHVSKKKSVIRRTVTDEAVTEPSQRKRKRSEMEMESQLFTCQVLTGSEERLTHCCLDIIILLLKQNLGTELFTANVASKILDSLLAGFDDNDGESEQVLQAICALALRITACGKASDSREESHGLLVSLARSLLLRTRESSAKVRAGALRVSSAVAQAVGDEYLVTLPESMPVLAEVIDDEQSSVQTQAKRFVRIMEGLAGESIMDQLK